MGKKTGMSPRFLLLVKSKKRKNLAHGIKAMSEILQP